jgi:hypothetical protein
VLLITRLIGPVWGFKRATLSMQEGLRMDEVLAPATSGGGGGYENHAPRL